MRFENKKAVVWVFGFALALASCSEDSAVTELSAPPVEEGKPLKGESVDLPVGKNSRAPEEPEEEIEQPKLKFHSFKAGDGFEHEDGVMSDVDIYVSPTTIMNGEKKRGLDISVEYRRNWIRVGGSKMANLVSEETADPVQIETTVRPKRGLYWAQKEIDPSYPLYSRGEPEVFDPMGTVISQYETTIHPVEGLTWGEVQRDEDLVIRVEKISRQEIERAVDEVEKPEFQPKSSEELVALLKSGKVLSFEDNENYVSRAKEGDPVLVAGVREVFLDPESSEKSRDFVLSLIGKIGGQAAFSDLRTRIEAIAFSDSAQVSDYQRSLAAQALGGIFQGSEDEVLIAKLRERMTLHPAKCSLKREGASLTAVGKIGGQKALQLLETAIFGVTEMDYQWRGQRDSTGVYFRSALLGLAEFGAEGIPLLFKAYAHFESAPLFSAGSEGLRGHAAEALGKAARLVDEKSREEVIDFLILKAEEVADLLVVASGVGSKEAYLGWVLIDVLARSENPRARGVLERLANEDHGDEVLSSAAISALLELGLDRNEKLEVVLQFLEKAEGRAWKRTFIVRLLETLEAFVDVEEPREDLVFRTYDFLAVEAYDSIVMNNLGRDASEAPLIFYSSHYFHDLASVFQMLRMVVDLDALPEKYQGLDDRVFAVQGAHEILSLNNRGLKTFFEDHFGQAEGK